MALTDNDYNKAEIQSKGYLEISAHDFYFDKVRPYIQDMLLTCRTDEELGRTMDKVINAADSSCVRSEYLELKEAFDVLLSVITGKTYFSGIMKNAPEEEKDKVRKLTEFIRDLSLIIQCEKPIVTKEQEPKARIDYVSPNGEKKTNGYNESYSKHNMEILSAPISKPRIPNNYY